MAREPDVALLMTASGSLDIFLTPVSWIKLFLYFSIYQTTKSSATPCSIRSHINSNKHVIKEKFRPLPLFEIADFALKMHALVSKLVALSVEKCYMALTEIQLKICRFHGSLSQKGSPPL